MTKFFIKWFQVVTLASSLVFASVSWAEDTSNVEQDVTERPSFLVITSDMIFARPLMLIGTAVGTAFFVVTLPITFVTGTVGEAGMSLVIEPASNTFVRCLGCTEPGWRKLPKKEISQ